MGGRLLKIGKTERVMPPGNAEACTSLTPYKKIEFNSPSLSRTVLSSD